MVKSTMNEPCKLQDPCVVSNWVAGQRSLEIMTLTKLGIADRNVVTGDDALHVCRQTASVLGQLVRGLSDQHCLLLPYRSPFKVYLRISLYNIQQSPSVSLRTIG